MTLHRTEGRGDAYSVKRLLGDMYDLSSNVALTLSTFGKLGYTLAFMVEQKAKYAASDKKAASIRDSMQAIEDSITEKITPVMAAMQSKLPPDSNVDMSAFRLLCANMVAQDELAHLVVLEQRLNEIALTWKDTTIFEAITVLMGKEAGKGEFPLADTVYLVQDKDRQWTKLAFVFGGSNVPDVIYAQNGDGWDRLDYDLSNPYVDKFFTSKRALLKFAYVHNFLVERLPSMLEQASDNFNPIASITPKTTSHIEEMALDDWLVMTTPTAENADG